MQSFLQYRRFGSLVKQQLDQDSRRAALLSKQDDNGGSPASFEAPDTTDNAGRDLEKSEDTPAIRHGPRDTSSRRESVESSLELAHHPTYEEEEVEYEEQDTRPHLSRASTQATQHTLGTSLGVSLTGIEVRDRTTKEGGDVDRQVFVVGFHGANDPMNPHNWSKWTRVAATIQVACVGAVVGVASSIDASALPQASTEFGVSYVTESLATGIFLAGFGTGSLFAGPISETLGRNPVYIFTLALYMIFIMASGLAPNIGAQLAFRFLAGFFGSTPLTCAGGSVADMWNPLERIYTFPIFANAAFMGPILGPVLGGWIASSSLISWRWTEWVTLIMSGLVFAGLVFFQPETYTPTLLKWKAEHLRKFTGDDRYAAPMEIREETFLHRLRRSLYRPFLMTAREPIIMLIALYLAVIYIILFTFLDGYTYIFGNTYGISQGLTGVCFVGIALGLCLSSALVPLIYSWAKRDLAIIRAKGGDRLPPEFRLWYSMLGGAIAIPVSLFWMGWTAYPSISIWSPLAASVIFGFGILSVFISCYQYIIDAYEIYAASALTSVTFIRYVAAGGMVVVGIPFYENMGVHWTLTILGAISALLVPIPYLFYAYGHRIRQKSKFAVAPELKECTGIIKILGGLDFCPESVPITNNRGPSPRSEDGGIFRALREKARISAPPDTTLSLSYVFPARPPYFSNGRSLTLHDYHNHQLTPAPSVPVHFRRLKRKAASSDLSAELPLRTLQTLDLYQPAVADLDQQGATLSHSCAITSTPQVREHKRPDYLVYGPQQSPHRVSSKNADNASHLPRHPKGLTYSVRSIKHSTPPRQSSHNAFGDPPPRTSIGSDKRMPTASLFSDTSNFSLSRFPLPPHASEQTPPNSSEGKNQSNEPKTPTVYHVRGASFDIINPHQSLRLQDIETPAEQDGECSEYFHTGVMTEPPDSKFAQMTPRHSNPHDQDGTRAKATPPRALFEDLPSAYTSITARSSRRYQQTAPLTNDLPLPPVPVAVREAPAKFEEVRLTDHSTLSVGHAISSGLPSSSSFRQRLSQVFRSKKQGHGQGSSNNEAETPLETTGASTQDHVGLHAGKLSVIRNSVNDELTDEVEFGRGNQFSSTAEANLSQHYYDHERSCAPSSREQSGSLDTTSLNPPKSTSPHLAGLDREISSNLILDAYNYDSAESNHDLRSVRRQSKPQMLPRSASEPTLNVDSTIGEIIEKYNRSHDSDPVQREPASDDLANYSTGKLSKEFRTVENPVLRPTTSGLSQFDFGLDRRRSHPSGFERAEPLPTRDVRVATIRALGVAPGVGPSIPLPSDPSRRLGPPAAHGFGPRSFSSFSDIPSWASSYGETHSLLAVSRQFPSAESDRDGGASTLSLPLNNLQLSSLAGLPSNSVQGSSRNRSNIGVFHLRDANPRAERLSQLTLEETITRDLRHLSGLSGLSSLSGSVYLLNETGASKEQESGRTIESPSARQQLQEDERKTPSATFLPIAAFPQSAVVPGYWRLSTAGRKALHREQPPLDPVPNEKPSSSDWNEEADELDWETVHDTRTVRSHNTQSSFAEYSSSNSLDPFRNVGVHPGDARYQHTYRIHSPANSDEPILLPLYDFGGGTGFPNRNALTTPSPAIYTYTHPIPLPKSHPNPFTSSPPQLTGSPSNATPNAEYKSVRSQEEGQNIPPFLWQRANLSVVHERTEEVSRPASKNSPYFLHKQDNANESIGETNFDVLAMDSSVWLSTEPGPEVSTGAEDGSPRGWNEKKMRPHSAMLSSGLDAGLLHVLREGDPRMASSPLSCTNSFAKLSHLGPKANVTGTPNGTGMREVGSSVAGSSSPFVPASSPPVVRRSSSIMPTTPGHGSGPYTRNSPLVTPTSPLALYDEIHYGHTMKQSRDYARPAVGSQKTLRAMTLGSRDKTDHPMSTTHMHKPSEQGIEYRAGSSSHTDRSLLPVARAQSPRCLRRHRSPSSYASATWKRKQQLSWVVFACCCFFPPLLLAYGHGIFDRTVAILTDGEIEHMGRRQKRVAKWAGYSGTVVVVLAVVILFVVVRTVPNDLPK